MSHITNSNNNNKKTAQPSTVGTSNTDFNLTNGPKNEVFKDRFRKVDKKRATMPVARTKAVVAVDWFAAMTAGHIEAPMAGEDVRWITDTTSLHFTGTGGKFLYSWSIVDDGEVIGTALTHPKPKSFMMPDTIKIELANHLFYDKIPWMQSFKKICADLNLTLKNINRFDIALDGVNSVYDFLNQYQANISNNDKSVLRKNSRVSFDPKKLNEKTGKYKAFIIGVKGGAKCVSVYEKKQEIEKISMHKRYIKDYWKANGLDINAEVYRCEMRLKNEAIKEIDKFDINKLDQPSYLIQIFQTMAENFFEFVENTDKNITRCKKIDLLNIYQFGLQSLDKLKRYVKQGCYKARMSIHNGVANVCKGLIPEGSIKAVFEHMRIETELYGLHDYVKEHVENWFYKYKLRENSNIDNILRQFARIQ